MQINLSFPNLKSISVNHAIGHSANNGFYRSYKTPELKAFEKYVNSILEKNHKQDRELFQKAYDENKYYICSEARFYLPIFIKDMSRLNKRASDTTNMLKYLEDTVAAFFGYDDSAIVPVNATRIHSQELRVEYQISLRDLNSIK